MILFVNGARKETITGAAPAPGEGGESAEGLAGPGVHPTADRDPIAPPPPSGGASGASGLLGAPPIIQIPTAILFIQI